MKNSDLKSLPLIYIHVYEEVAIISGDKITKLLEESGSGIEGIYGDFSKSKFQNHSPRLVTKKE